MGWDFGPMRHGNTTAKQECDDQLTWTGAEQSNAVISSAMVGRVHYAAVKISKTNTTTFEPVKVIGVVTLTEGNARDFGTKKIGEDMGPCESECPAHILDLLDPLDAADPRNTYAIAWRDRCRANAARKAA